jgi:hypothetical protein
MNKVLLWVLVLALLMFGPGCVKTEEGAVIKKGGAAEKAPVTQSHEIDKESTIVISAVSDTSVTVSLNNSAPVRGVQFTLQGARISDVRTTPRTGDFMAKFNEENGRIILISLSRAVIAPGTDPILEIDCEQPASANISGVKVAK